MTRPGFATPEPTPHRTDPLAILSSTAETWPAIGWRSTLTRVYTACN